MPQKHFEKKFRMNLCVVLKSFEEKKKKNYFHQASFLKSCAVDSADLIGRVWACSALNGLETSEV